MLGFGLIKDVLEFAFYLLIFSGGIYFNQKWPAAASKVAFIWTTAEALAKWVYGMFKATATKA